MLRRRLTKANSMLEGVHHINFLVADLDAAIERYKDFFGVDSVQIESEIRRDHLGTHRLADAAAPREQVVVSVRGQAPLQRQLFHR